MSLSLPDSSSGRKAEKKRILNSQVDSQHDSEKTNIAQILVNKDTEKTSVLPEDNKNSKEESELQESDLFQSQYS